MTQQLYAYVSSWTSGADGAGADGGIHVFAVDMHDGSFQLLSTTAMELNAGYICISPNGRFLYATDERKDYGGRAGAGGGIVSFSIDPQNGALTRLNIVPSMGAFPAYIAIDATGTCVVTANHGSYNTILQIVQDATGAHLENTYDDSTVALFPVGADGLVDQASTVAILQRGSAEGWEQDHGIAARFRASAHAHSVNFDPNNCFVLACDKGRDRIYSYRVEASSLQLAPVVAPPARTAPRHSAVPPTRPYVFVIDELVPRLLSYAFNPVTGELRAIQAVSTVSDAEETQGLPADIHVHPSGRFVYGSTRGSNTIASFAIDEATGLTKRNRAINVVQPVVRESMFATPPFLDAHEIGRNCADANLDKTATKTLLDLAQRINAEPDLYSVTTSLHHSLYETREDFTAALSRADASFGAEADVLHSLLILDSMRLVREKQHVRGVPSEITRAVNQRHAVSWLNNAIAERGSVGMLEWGPSWMRTIGSGELYRLGRLEFILYVWDYPFRAYTNIHTHEMIVLAENGQHFTADGYRAGITTWTSTLVDTHDAVVGIPISPRGHALPQLVRLPHTEWQLALSQGDHVLDCMFPGKAHLRWTPCTMRWLRQRYSFANTILNARLWPTPVALGSSARSLKPCFRLSRIFCAGSTRAISFRMMVALRLCLNSHSVQTPST